MIFCRRTYPRPDDDIIGVQLLDSSLVPVTDTAGNPIITSQISGDCFNYTPPILPDNGRTFPRRVRIDCEAPLLPAPSCGDPSFTIVYNPDAIPPFSVVSTLKDQNCNVVTDNGNNPILTIVQ